MMFQLCKDTSEPCPKKMIKIRNVSSSVVKVTGHGHSVKSGECAFVHEDQQYLQRAISKGLVVVVGESAKEEKTPKKRVRAPKEQVSQEEVVVRQDSEQSQQRSGQEETTSDVVDQELEKAETTQDSASEVVRVEEKVETDLGKEDEFESNS